MAEVTDPTRQEQDGLVGQASARVQDATSTAQEKASELKQQGSARLRDQLDTRSTEAGSQARSFAESLRRNADDLRTQGNSGAANAAQQAADRIDRLGGYLEQKSGDEMMRDIENFARRRPWMIAGLGLLVGVAASRFVKASSENRYSTYGGATGQGWSRTGYPYAGGDGVGAGTVEPGTPGEIGTYGGTLYGGAADEPLTREATATQDSER